MGNKNYFFSGISELLILAILNKQDSYAYEINKSITEFSNGKLNISQNTIYAATYKLENEGKISQYTKLVGKRRTRVYYHIEESGKEFYTAMLDSFRETFSGVENVLTLLSENKEDSNE